jgi:putative hydrolase of HD superfamily
MDFIKIVGKLKKLPRTGWLKSEIEKPESVAEHSFRTAVIAMILADLRGQDTQKSMRMALLHDLAEVEIGDLTPEQRGRSELYAQHEDEAMINILSTLPKFLAERYLKLWKEYHGMASPEAETVNHADKIEMMLQAIDYEESGIAPYKLDRFWQSGAVNNLPPGIIKILLRMRPDLRARSK